MYVFIYTRLEVRTLAVRENGVSWHNGGPIKGPFPLILLNMVVLCAGLRGFRGPPTKDAMVFRTADRRYIYIHMYCR